MWAERSRSQAGPVTFALWPVVGVAAAKAVLTLADEVFAHPASAATGACHRLPRGTAGFCVTYRQVTTITTPKGSDERGEPMARCTLRDTLPALWPGIVAASD